jgi:hypothetical protein
MLGALPISTEAAPMPTVQSFPAGGYREGTTICWLAALSINSTIAFSMVERLGVALGV